jgi:hypothetical protein
MILLALTGISLAATAAVIWLASKQIAPKGLLEFGVIRDSTINSTNDFQLFGESFGTSLIASGGLCAPLSPIYTLPSTPVRDAITSHG